MYHKSTRCISILFDTNKHELNLYYYTTKADLKNEKGVDTSKFAKKVDLASLKSDVVKLDIDKVDKLDVNKLVSVPVDWVN